MVVTNNLSQILIFDKFHATLETNLFGPLYMTTALYKNVKDSDNGKIITISSKMGSIGDSSGGMAIYRTSKTAINMAMHALASEAANDNVVFPQSSSWMGTNRHGWRASANYTPRKC